MYSKEKIKWMTQAALYEQRQKRTSMHIHKFTRSDYMAFYLFKILICATIAFCIIAGGAALYMIEIQPSILKDYPVQIWLLGGLMIYAFVMFVYTIAVLIVYSKRYDQAESASRRYLILLKGIKAQTVNQNANGKNKEAKQ